MSEQLKQELEADTDRLEAETVADSETIGKQEKDAVEGKLENQEGKEDVYSGNGLNFFGEKNYIVTTMACYKDILPDFRSGKFANYMSEKHPDSSIYYGVMVAIPFWGEATEEFNDPTPLSEDRNWKLEIVLPCRQGIRTKSMTELLFCMLRSGR